MIDALDDFGFGSWGLTADDVLTPDTVVQLRYLPQRIDLITSPDDRVVREAGLTKRQRSRAAIKGASLAPEIPCEEIQIRY